MRSTLLLRLLAFAGLGLSGAGCSALYYIPPAKKETPAEVRFVTDDIPRFYAALDRAGDPLATALDAHYLDGATPGLRALDALSIGGAERLAAVVGSRRGYYDAIREAALSVHTSPAVLDSVRAALSRLDALYPAATFPDVYFAVGRMNTGGTLAAPGLLIGVELFTRGPDAPTDGLSDWQRTRARGLDALPHIVVHEAVHAQQSLRTLLRRSLLARALIEGGADFVASLATGDRLAPDAHAWARDNEAAVWRAFADAMDGGDATGWFYGAPPVEGWPGDLGYVVGFRIAEAYYDRVEDKRGAIRDLLRLRHPEWILHASGYGERF